MNNSIDRPVTQTTRAVTDSLADVLERVLDKGIVIAGDIKIQLADIDLINIKIRLLVTSVDKAREIGLDWWEQDSFLSSRAKKLELEEKNKKLNTRIANLEKKLLKKPKP